MQLLPSGPNLDSYIAVLLCLLTAATTSAHPIHRSNPTDHPAPPSSDFLSSSSPLPLTTRSPLLRLSNGWLGHLSTSTAPLPLAHSLPFFDAFYTTIMSDILAFHSTSPQVSALRFALGELVLEISSTEQLVPVPWNLVLSFASAMQSAARRGFAGGYRGYFSHPTLPRGVGVFVSLVVGQVVEGGGIGQIAG